MSGELKVGVSNIRNVTIKSKVVENKAQPAKVVTAVSFEYDGEPSEMQAILMLEAQNQPIDVVMSTAQLPLSMDEK